MISALFYAELSFPTCWRVFVTQKGWGGSPQRKDFIWDQLHQFCWDFNCVGACLIWYRYRLLPWHCLLVFILRHRVSSLTSPMSLTLKWMSWLSGCLHSWPISAPPGRPPLTDFSGIVGTSACVFTNPAAGLDSDVNFWDFCRVGACLLWPFCRLKPRHFCHGRWGVLCC